jgi:hypothetical protein
MRSTVSTLLLASALAIGTSAAFAQSYRTQRYDSDEMRYGARDDYRAETPFYYGQQGWRNPPYGLGRLYRPDPATCRPGACRDNPYY